MNSFFNYLIEANLALIIFVCVYYLLFRNDTNFRVVRIVMLAGTLAAIAFPLLHFNNVLSSGSIPSLRQTIPTRWLPEFVVTSDGTRNIAETGFDVWSLLFIVYTAGVVVSFCMFLFQIVRILRMINRSAIQAEGKFRVVELGMSSSSFSFFNFICIGSANNLTAEEKLQIIRHEVVHARQWHSADMVIISVLRILFWFNPFITIYKKIFVQLHEFEADARAVENQDMNRYCNLLARVALQSAGLNVASHFNSSLTVKRIQMMRTLKTKLKHWKLVSAGAIIVILFVGIACQDQVGLENKVSLPEEVTDRFEQFKLDHPGRHFLVEYDQSANATLADLEGKYGKAQHIELITVTVNKELRTYSMIQYNGKSDQPAVVDHDVFTSVDDMPEFQGGHEAMVEFIRDNLQYPGEARMKGIEGTSFIEFIVEKDGSVSNVRTLKGISTDCDLESERVVKIFPSWKPGKLDGEVVRVRFVIPIKFMLQ